MNKSFISSNNRLLIIVSVSITIILLSLFSACAILRRLNFDESLLVRSGWLSFNNIEYAPAFFMPVTLLSGFFATHIPDPGILFISLRLLTLSSIIFCYQLCIKKSSSILISFEISTLFLFTNCSFIVHGFEFRYDWAILLGLLLSLYLLQNENTLSAFICGAIITLTAFHHTKGLYYAFWIYCVALYTYTYYDRVSLKKRILYLHTGIAFSFVIWLLLCFLLSKIDESIQLYRTFIWVAKGVHRNLFNIYFYKALKRDSMWWLSVVCLIAAFLKNFKTIIDDRFLATTMLFLVATLIFPFLHPRPWPYMLALAVPFASLLVTYFFSNIKQITPKWHFVILGIIILVCHTTIGTDCTYKTYKTSLQHNRERQITMMRRLKSISHPDQKILDPSGLAYFLIPCTSEWYTDQLFRPKSEQRTWMNDLLPSLDSCTWIVSTYRLSYLDSTVNERIRTSFIPVGTALMINRIFFEKNPNNYIIESNFSRLTTFW